MSPNFLNGSLAAGPPETRFPYEPIAPPLQRVIQKAICAAWRIVLDDIRAGRCDSSREVSLNAQLEKTLGDLMNSDPPIVPGFSPESFETPIRGGEVWNYDGSSIEKRPDLTFRLAGRRPSGVIRAQHGLFVECKVIDGRDGLRDYGEKGIMRFIRGEYAWAMPHAMMIGYVRTPRLELATFLTEEKDKYDLDGAPRSRNDQDGESLQRVESSHRRRWRYPLTNCEPGPIHLLHIWLGLS